MSKIKNISILFLILIPFLLLSGCGIGRAFHGGYHHRDYNYSSFEDHYGPNYNYRNYSNNNSGYCWR